MKVIDTNIQAIKLIEPTVFVDERGYFMETWNHAKFCQQVSNEPVEFVQDNHSLSIKGTLRGLHFQSRNTQGKLIRVLSGEIFDVAVDLRHDSNTYGQWVGTYLSGENKRQLWIPPGFAHGFYVTSDVAECAYKCSQYYDPSAEVSLAWDDPTLGIQWPVTGNPLLSNRDKHALLLAEVSPISL